MKKHILVCLLSILFLNVYAQKVIDNPEYGFSTVSGELTKIEFLRDTTVLHFHVNYRPGYWIYVPRKTFIKPQGSNEKLFVEKAVGVPLAKRYFMPESGEVDYKLYFPEVSESVGIIDFGEDNDGGNWFINDIIVNENKIISKLPKALRGNWLRNDGSNQWDYGFNLDKAIVDAKVWEYKSVKNKKQKYTITLERNGITKIIHAQIDKSGQVKIGPNKKELLLYSTDKTHNPNFKLDSDNLYELPILKNDSTTYSGVIKGFNSRVKERTGMIYVDNVFTGNQDSYIVKIEDDGSFSVRFPISHPQFILTRLGNQSESIFVEPGKATFHYINNNKNLFMGEMARVNTDLNTMKDIRYFDYPEMRKNILTIKPEDYKANIINVEKKELVAVDKLVKEQFISQKALQLKKIDIKTSALKNIISYDLNKSSAKRSLEQKKDSVEVSDYKLEASYYDLITEEVLNDKLAVMSSNYSSLINRLMYADVFRKDAGKVRTLNTSELVELFKEEGVELTLEELEMAEMIKEIETPERKKRRESFNEKYLEKYSSFYKKHIKVFKEIANQNSNSSSLSNIESLKQAGVELNQEELQMLEALDAISTPEEEELAKEFNKKYGEILKAFHSNHKSEISETYSKQYAANLNTKMKKILGVEESFVFDVVKLQQVLRKVDSEMTPLGNSKIGPVQKHIKDLFLADYVVHINEKVKAKILANKDKTGYHVNTVAKSEGDELFESMIAKFKGKVVYVDFWATWCGPCRSGIQRIKPLKEELKNEDVVFLYITGPSSPEKTWENFIPNVKGEHYRVTADEWNYLGEKFNITGIPHYALVGKNGRLISEKLGHKSNDELRRLFDKYVNMTSAYEEFQIAYTNIKADKENNDFWDTFKEKANNYYSKEFGDAVELKRACLNIIKNHKKFNDLKALELPISWCERVLANNSNNHIINDTYASILYAKGEIEKALKHEEIAIAQADAERHDWVDKYKIRHDRYKKALAENNN